MRGAGRMRKAGYNVEWGLGRHGPGNNVFTYFVEPNGFVTEYTTEVDQVDEATGFGKQDPAGDRHGGRFGETADVPGASGRTAVRFIL